MRKRKGKGNVRATCVCFCLSTRVAKESPPLVCVLGREKLVREGPLWTKLACSDAIVMRRSKVFHATQRDKENQTHPTLAGLPSTSCLSAPSISLLLLLCCCFSSTNNTAWSASTMSSGQRGGAVARNGRRKERKRMTEVGTQTKQGRSESRLAYDVSCFALGDLAWRPPPTHTCSLCCCVRVVVWCMRWLVERRG